jgi:alkylresorcinol/alkylpyrone synthase
MHQPVARPMNMTRGLSPAHAAASLPVAAGLRSLATAVPPHLIRQDDVRESAKAYFSTRTGLFEHLEPVFTNARIDTRYACMPYEWYLAPHDFGEKSALYAEHATALALEVAEKALADAALGAQDIDAIVCVSSTGILTPSLDARLMNLLPFRRDTVRLPIFGYGCAGGVLGLTRAAQLAQSRPGSRVLVIVVELCSMALRHDRWTPSNIVATALFGDGAAAAVIESGGSAGMGRPSLGMLGAGGEHCWQDTLDIMGWRVDGLGLDVIFQYSIPTVIAEDYPAALAAFLARNDLTPADIARPCCHPGGVKVLDALEDVLGLPRDGLDVERGVLRDYGNMSAPTVLFVLERLVRAGTAGPLLLSSLGPGFCAAFQMIDLAGPE